VADIHKTKGDQATVQLAAIAKHTGWPQTEYDWHTVNSICLGPIHDKVDAYSAAWVASLPEEKLSYFGDPEKQDVIWIPAIEPIEFAPVRTIRKPVRSKIKSCVGTGNNQKLCPACGKHLFKRWPFGWDAHAAYRCDALRASAPEDRKAEFKSRFM